MSISSEFQTFGAATQNAHLAVSVRIQPHIQILL